MKTQRLVCLSLFALLAASGLSACGKKKGSSSDPSAPAAPAPGTGTTDGGTADTGSLLSAYPSQLALAIFTGDEGSALRLAGDDEAKEAAKLPIKERAAEEEKLVKGEADSCFPAALERKDAAEAGESCYEFDQDMLLGARGGALGANLGTKDGKNKAGEACLVAFAKDRASVINDMLDKAKGMIAAMMCQAKKANPDVALPAAAGESLDLAEILATAFGDKADKIEIAKIERLDDKDDLPVYRSVVKMAMGDASRTVVMVHSPSEDGTYKGSLFTVSGKGAGKQQVLSIVYAKSLQDDGSFRMNAELRRAGVASELMDDVIDASGQLDFNVGRDFSVAASDPSYGKRKKAAGGHFNMNEDMEGQTRITFQINPETDEGSFAYWQNPGSNYSEAARGLVANIALEDGVKKGCAVSGAALGKTNLMEAYSIARALKDGAELEPVGFYHPFYNDMTSGDGSGKVWTYATGSDAEGSFFAKEIDTEKRKWYLPKVTDAALANEFATKQAGGIVTRQCYVFDDASGLYHIDADVITETAGYELVLNTDSAKMVAPPKVDGEVKPFDGAVKAE